jgi:hypothetical protein
MLCLVAVPCTAQEPRLRAIIETDAGGDPDGEQSLVRFLVCANEFDTEGIIANRPDARERGNRNPSRDGLGIVRAQVNAYGQCYANVIQHANPAPHRRPGLPRSASLNHSRGRWPS